MSWRCVVLSGLVLLGASSSEAQPAVRQVLLLQSFDRGNLIVDHFTGGFRVELDRNVGRPLNVIQVVVGQAGLGSASEQAVVDYIRATFADRPRPDLIVTVAGPAALFARKYRQQLFPDTPILFGVIDQRYLGDAPLGDNETAVAAANDFPGFIDGILQLLPQTRQVFTVMGSGQTGQFWRRELEKELARYQDRLTFVWSDDLSLPEILKRTASLPPDAVIFYFAFGTDAAGAAYADERVLADLHAAASVPMFGLHSAFLGTGIVGGTLLPIDDLSRSAADVAVRLLNGAPPGTVRMPPLRYGQPTFDGRELQRWNIPESRLPAGSVVRYRGPSLWREYRGTVLGAAGALAIQAVLIAGLLYERRARQRAEIDSRKNLALAADASRRATMSALTSGAPISTSRCAIRARGCRRSSMAPCSRRSSRRNRTASGSVSRLPGRSSRRTAAPSMRGTTWTGARSSRSRCMAA